MAKNKTEDWTKKSIIDEDKRNYLCIMFNWYKVEGTQRNDLSCQYTNSGDFDWHRVPLATIDEARRAWNSGRVF